MRLVRLSAAMVVALGGFAGTALLAGPAYTARFTLQHEVTWGRAVLPAGSYTATMESVAGPLSITDEDGRVRALVAGFPDTVHKNRPAAILVTGEGSERVVRSLNAPDWGYNFVYRPFTLAERQLMARGGQVESVALRLASR